MSSFRRLAALFLLLLLCFALVGCGAAAEAETPTLWIVTETSNFNGMNQQIEQVIKAFQADHPDFEVQLDILPIEEDERELTLQKLHSLLLAGDGPDLLLLPSCDARIYLKKDARFDEDKTISYRGLEQLLPDPVQSMRSGLFLDISEYYDNDETLGKEALQQTIMDAGTLGDARYILPLRYDFPAVYIWDEGVEALGIDPEELTEGIIPTLQAALEVGNSQLASGLLPSFCRMGSVLALLSDPLDYGEEQVTLDAEELAEFLALYQNAETLAEGNQDGRVAPDIDDYIDTDNDILVYNKGLPTYEETPGDAYPHTIPAAVATFSQAYQAAAIAKAESRQSCQMLPLPASDGKLTAWVTYYGAITAGCDYPEEAYDFLRRFLLEENQWEQNRPLDEDKINFRTFRLNLIEDGWPVRYKGFLADIWQNMREYYLLWGSTGDIEANKRLNKIQRVRLTDADIPLLDAEIDRVYFGNSLEQELAETIRSLNDEDTGEAIPADLDALAEEFVKELKYQLLEG